MAEKRGYEMDPEELLRWMQETDVKVDREDLKRGLNYLLSVRDRYRAALEEINRLPAAIESADLQEIRFRAVNISFKALHGTTET